VGRPGGKRIRAWFDTKLVAEAAATERNLSIQRFGQQAATFSGSLAYMAMECQSRCRNTGRAFTMPPIFICDIWRALTARYH
jgi:hypothetical protein